MKTKLKKGEIRLQRPAPRSAYRDCDTRHIDVALPFCTKRHLIHRVRYASEHYRCGKLHHISYTLWCNAMAFSGDHELTADPDGKNHLLCEVCERNATRMREPTTEKLIGRHIHTGRMVPKQTCHVKERERN